MKTEDALGIWSRLCCSPGVGWLSSCSPLQEGGSAEDPRFTPTLLLWPAPESWELTKGSSCPLTTYLLEILVHMKAQPNPQCGGPELSRLTRDLAQLTSAKGLWEALREVEGRWSSASALLRACIQWCKLPIPHIVHSESVTLCFVTKDYAAQIGRDLLGVKRNRKAKCDQEEGTDKWLWIFLWDGLCFNIDGYYLLSF